MGSPVLWLFCQLTYYGETVCWATLPAARTASSARAMLSAAAVSAAAAAAATAAAQDATGEQC